MQSTVLFPYLLWFWRISEHKGVNSTFVEEFFTWFFEKMEDGKISATVYVYVVIQFYDSVWSFLSGSESVSFF